MVKTRRADVLFAGFALSILVVVTGYRYGWQAFHHEIPRDKLKIDVENAASTAAMLGLVTEQHRANRLPANYVHTVGDDTAEELDEEWSHTLERSAPGEADSVLHGYRTTLASLDSASRAMAKPTFDPAAAGSLRPGIAAIDSTLRALERRL
jgi:hypothetical protein